MTKKTQLIARIVILSACFMLSARLPAAAEETAGPEMSENNVSLGQYKDLVISVEDPEDQEEIQTWIADYLAENSVVNDVPEELVAEEEENIRAYYQDLADFYEMELYDFADAYFGLDENAFDGELSALAQENAKQQLIYEAIAEAEGLNAEDNALDAEVMNFIVEHSVIQGPDIVQTSSESDVGESSVMASAEAETEPVQAYPTQADPMQNDSMQTDLAPTGTMRSEMTLHERLALLEEELALSAEGKSTIERVEAIMADLGMTEIQSYSIAAMIDEIEEKMYGYGQMSPAAAQQVTTQVPEADTQAVSAEDQAAPADTQAVAAEAQTAPTDSQASTAEAQAVAAGGQTAPAADSTQLQEYTDGTTIYFVQLALTELGYDCGKADGVMGNKTITAIAMYEAQSGLTVDCKITDALLSSLGIVRQEE